MKNKESLDNLPDHEIQALFSEEYKCKQLEDKADYFAKIAIAQHLTLLYVTQRHQSGEGLLGSPVDAVAHFVNSLVERYTREQLADAIEGVIYFSRERDRKLDDLF